MKYFHQSKPIKIPVPGNKLIEEHFGLASTQHKEFSLAHMIAPPQWGEPPQKPEFDELTIMIKGSMKIVLDKETVTIKAGETFWVKAGHKVQYSNPFDEESEYWAVCFPAFEVGKAHREEE